MWQFLCAGQRMGTYQGNLEKYQIQMDNSAGKEAPSIFCRMNIDIIRSHPRAQSCQHSFRLNFSYGFLGFVLLTQAFSLPVRE